MFVSYAQNFEDVILWRALKQVEHGFYVDIGAQDPIIDSVSLAFYEKGWRGVHVEPSPSYAAKLRAARMDEDVIEVAIARSASPVTWFEMGDTSLSTGKFEIARRHAKSGVASKSVEVLALPLSEVFARYPNREIHWLRIDVDGMEDEVIASWRPSQSRPWVVVVESAIRNSQQPDHASWEPNLLSLGYIFVHFDRQNRFYVHRDREQLRTAFGGGPNIFDELTLSANAGTLSSETADRRNQIGTLDDEGRVDLAEMEHLRHRTALLERRCREKDAQLGKLRAERSMLAERVSLIQSSTSWRLTRPLRGLQQSSRFLAAWPRTITRYGLDHAFAWLHCRPRASALAKSLFRYLPPLERRFVSFSSARRVYGDVDVVWTLEPDPEILHEWQELLQRARS